MKRKSAFTGFLIGLIIFSWGFVHGSDRCNRPPDNKIPPVDHADDNFSYNLNGTSNADVSNYIVQIPFLGILKNGNISALDNLLLKTGRQNFYVEEDFNPHALLKNMNLLIIPTGGLMGMSNSGNFKLLLTDFLERGGTILCFASQDSEDYRVIPVPEGETLHAQGWRNMQSCLYNSVYFSQPMHPIFSGQTNQRISAGVDGGFSAVPSGTTVLLRRTANNEPALIAYPYGQNGGMVFLSATYSDWSFSKGYCSLAEVKLIRDIVTYCKSPLPIPMFNLEETPNPGIALAVKIKNSTASAAALAKLTAYTPDRDRVLYETRQSIALNAGEEAEIPVEFTLPNLENSQMGIGHVDYELYDQENNLIQLPTESASGRFAVYELTETFTYNRPVDVWITVKKEEVYFSEPAEMTFHLRNNTEEAKTLDLKYSWNHDIFPQELQTITIPAKEQVDLEFNINAPSYADFLSYYRGGRVEMLFRLWYGSGTQGTDKFSQATKGVVFKTYVVGSTILKLEPDQVKVGDPFSYTITVKNESGIAIGDTAIAVTLEKLGWPSNTYMQIAKLFETTRSLAADETFTYKGNYTPDPAQGVHESGMYRLKFSVQRPEGSKEERYSYFFYIDSNIGVKIDPLPKDFLVPGSTYPVKITLAKHSFLSVYNGRCSIIFKTIDGREACRKNLENIVMHGYYSNIIDETITFQPTVLAPYYLLFVEYSDETMLIPKFSSSGHRYQFQYRTSLTLDKEAYFYKETAPVTLTISGGGTFDVHFTCAAAGLDEQRVVTIPAGSVQDVETFPVPISLPVLTTPCSASVEVTSREGYYPTSGKKKSILVPIVPLRFETRGTFGAVTAKVGEPLDFSLALKSVSGHTIPLEGQLKVSFMNFTDVKGAILEPNLEKTVSYSIPLEESIPAGTYYLYAAFEHEGQVLVSKNFPIQIPAPGIGFSEPTPQLNAGDTVTLTLENPGGKNGSYQWDAYLKDQKGKALLSYTTASPISIPAGTKEEITLTIPLDAGSGPYLLFQKARETSSGLEKSHYSQHQLSGLSLSLNSYTLLNKYFTNEPVSGKAEITLESANTGGLENARLDASILRFIQSRGIEEQKPGEFIPYNMIETGFCRDNLLFLVTDKGVLSLQPGTNTVNVLYSFSENEGFNSRDIEETSTGELWIASSYGIWRYASGQWFHYTMNQGLADDWIYDLMIVDTPGGTPETWAATYGGISVFGNGQWVKYTKTNGLPSNVVYRLARDGSGTIWASTSGGVVKFDGTKFITANAPFGTTGVSEKMTATADGCVWMATSSKLYRRLPDTGTWNEWTLTSIYPSLSLSIHDMETINGRLWIKARTRLSSTSDFFNVLLQENGTGNFTAFTEQEIPGLAGLSYSALIPGSSEGNGNETAYFICEVGMMNLNAGSWSRGLLDIDSDKLCGEIRSLGIDSQGRLWAGTDYGFSLNSGFEGRQWINYYADSGNRLLLDIAIMDFDSQNRVYGFSSPTGGVLRLENENIELIPFPYDLGYYPQSDDQMAVDTQGRTWLGSSYLYYHDGNAWNQYAGIRYVKCMTHDHSGGIWLGSWNDYTQFHLEHIKNDLSLEDYTASNSGLLPGEKDRLYLDPEGILRINRNAAGSLQSFDGTNWIDYTGYEGYPSLGVVDFVEDNSGRLHVVDPNGVLYMLQTGNNRFVLEMEQTYYRHSLTWWQDRLYCVGNTEGSSGGGDTCSTASTNNLLALSTATGLTEQEIWSQTYDVNLSGGSSVSLEVNPGTLSGAAPGGYLFRTRLYSANGRELAESDHSFILREPGISVSIAAAALADSASGNCGNYVKKNTALEFGLEAFNSSEVTREGLNLAVKQISPSGIETEILNQALSLTPGESKAQAFQFNESETGTWKLQALISGETGTGLSMSEMVVEVVEPGVITEITGPDYVGDEPFSVKVKIVNPGKIEAALECEITGVTGTGGTGETLETLSFSLKPGEERIIQVEDTLSSDKTYTVYTFAFSGDIEKSETKTVRYGYAAQFNLEILPSYREGNITMGYRIANAGGLPFQDQVHFDLYTVGAAQPFQSRDRKYLLYPGAEPAVDTLEWQLLPGNYVLKYQTAKSNVDTDTDTGAFAWIGSGEYFFTVTPSGIGTVTLLEAGPYPEGQKEIRYRLTNSDSVGGAIGILITAGQGETILYSQSRHYYLEPGEAMEDSVALEFPAVGNYLLTITGSKLAAPVQQVLSVLPWREIESHLTIDAPAGNLLPASVTIINRGYENFTGAVVMEVEGNVKEEPVNVPSGSQWSGTIGMDTGVLMPGSKQVLVYLKDETGVRLSEQGGTVMLKGADLQVIEVPGTLEIEAGGYADTALTVRNEGQQRGEAVLKVTALDTLFQEREIVLDPGEEIEIADIFIDVPADMPTGNYPFYYTLSGTGVESGRQGGNFNFKVKGLSLEVGASLDRSLYNPGETAALTLDVSSTTTSSSAVPLEAVVNWGNFSETRPFTLENNSASLVFNIPLEEARADKIFYGIYHEEGKGIHLNDIYLNFKGGINSGGISVELDKQVYAPGEIVHAVFTGAEGGPAGTLTASAFDESYTMNLSGSASASFQVPTEALGGTYGIDWSFEPIAAPNTSNTSNLSDSILTGVSGSHPFDVSGLVVKTAKAELERGKYAPGETLKAYYIFESNRDQVLEQRSWSMTPTGAWEYLGESSVTVSGSRQVDGLSSYSFTTTEAGTHRLVYGLYQGEELVVSGSMAFDVGDAVMLGISPDQQEYKTGAEPVKLRVDYFGQGAAQMEVYLDGESFVQQSIALSGIGSTEIILDGSRISGGTHTIKGVFTQNGLISVKTTQIVYGTELPDLVINLVATVRDGLNYTYKLEVVNNGKAVSGATTVVFSDNGVEIGTVNIPSLEPRGAGGLLEFTSSRSNFSNHPSSTTPGSTLSPLLRAKSQELRAQVSFYWTGSGKAGTHELVFEVDKAGAVKEFSEVNNRVEITEEVPALFYSLGMNPPDLFTYPANTPMSIVTRLINNRESAIQLNLELSIVNDETGVIVHNRTRIEQLAAYESKTLTEIFNTGTYPAGSYCLKQTLTGVNENMQREVSLMLEPTAIISGTFQVQPRQIPANISTEVQLALDLKNDGNISLENEILHLDVFNKDAGEVELSEEMAVAIPYGEEISMSKALTLNLAAGNYEIWLKHGEEIIATADLSAAAAIKPSITIDIHPRVLLLLPSAIFSREDTRRDAKKKIVQIVRDCPCPSVAKTFIDLLHSQSIPYDIGCGSIDSYIKFHKGQANVNIIIGNEMAHWLRGELKERIWRGEGLILRCDKPVQNPDWKDFLGVTLKPIPGHRRETVVQVLPNELSSGGKIQLQEKVDLQIIPEQNDVVIVAQTKQGHYPVMAYRKYGKGDILVITMPMEISQGREVMAQLLVNAINRYSRDIYSGTHLTRQMPIEISIKNETPAEKELMVKAILPYGVEVIDSEPKPGPGEELKWKVTIPGSSTAAISAWLLLPDKIGTYEVKIELYEGETLAAEESMTWEVSQTISSYINELIREIEAIAAEGKDKQRIRKAVDHLEKIRSRIGDEMTDYLMNLQDAVQAAGYIGEVENTDVSEQRQKAQEIMFAIGRWFYEKVILLPHPPIILKLP